MRLFLLLFLSATQVVAQNIKEKELKTSIEEVTVFLDGAQIFEHGSVPIPTGNSVLRIKNVSPFMDAKSIQVKAGGEFTILSVNHRYNFLNALNKNDVIDSLQNLLDNLQTLSVAEQSRLSVLNEKQTLLDANKNLGGTTQGTTLAQLQQAMDFYDRELSRIKEEENRIHKSIEKRKAQENQLIQQLKEQHDRKVLPTSEIEIRVSSEKQVIGKFTITYLVGNAGWFPKYDVRVSDIANPLQLTYKAEVFQNTGVDWKNVKLKFSNGTPNQSGVVPQLPVWHLNYARNTIYKNATSDVGMVRGIVIDDAGQPIPGVNIIVKGTTIGTVTDVHGKYSLTLPYNGAQLVVSFIGYNTQEITVNKPELNIQLQPDVQQLSEVVITGYALQGRTPGVQIRGINSIRDKATNPITSTIIENQTTVEIAVDIPYSIKSDGEKLMIALRSYSIPAEYEYYAVPKLDKDAFLIARIVNWDQYNLLEGETNLYFEDAFIGRSILNAKALTDTLTLSLGRDKNIVIGRTKAEQFSKKRFIGSNVTETRGFKISIRNKKSLAIKITLYDQVPVSVLSDITVNPLELNGGTLDENNGKITWTATIAAQQQKELNFLYEIKYPKHEKIILE